MSFSKSLATAFFAILIAYFASACTPSVNPTPVAKTQTELLTAPTWRLDSFAVNGTISRTSLKSWKFNANGTGSATYTTPGGPDSIDSTTWAFTNSAQTMFRMGSKSVPVANHQTGTIESLTEKRLQVSFLQNTDRYVAIFSAQ